MVILYLLVKVLVTNFSIDDGISMTAYVNRRLEYSLLIQLELYLVLSTTLASIIVESLSRTSGTSMLRSQ